MVELGLVESLSHDTVRLHLKNTLKPWWEQRWYIPKVSADFVAHLEDILALYAEPFNPQRPIVCFGETSAQLQAEIRDPLQGDPGCPRLVDYEYLRRCPRNLFLNCEPFAGWRHVEATERRPKVDFAQRRRCPPSVLGLYPRPVWPCRPDSHR